MKAATILIKIFYRLRHISIHAAREGGDATFFRGARWDDISIHAAREGGDEEAKAAVMEVYISIHAAREGGDDSAGCSRSMAAYFNPRRP